MILHTSHGTGDAYMTLAFADAYARHRGEPVSIDIKDEEVGTAWMVKR